MFYCKYCRKDRDDSLIAYVYKQSIKCDICVKNCVSLANRRHKCECGVTHFYNHTTTRDHQTSKIHLQYLQKLATGI